MWSAAAAAVMIVSSLMPEVRHSDHLRPPCLGLHEQNSEMSTSLVVRHGTTKIRSLPRSYQLGGLLQLIIRPMARTGCRRLAPHKPVYALADNGLCKVKLGPSV